MVWFRVDDGLPQSIKILSIPRLERAAAVGLWTLAGAWSAGQLTDGFVPDYVVAELPGGGTHRDYLLIANLWAAVTHPVTQEPGIRFHDWADYQPSKVDVEIERARRAAKQKAYRERKRTEQDAQIVTGHTGVTGGPRYRVPTQPSPAQPDPAQPSPVRSSFGTTGVGSENARTRPKSTGTKRAEDLAAIVDEIEAERAANNGATKQIGP